MGSKAFLLIVLAILLVITSKVAARELADSKVSDTPPNDGPRFVGVQPGYERPGGFRGLIPRGGYGGYRGGGVYPGVGYGGYRGGGYGGYYGGYPGGGYGRYYGGYPGGGYGGSYPGGGYGGGYPRGGWYGGLPRN